MRVRMGEGLRMKHQDMVPTPPVLFLALKL